MNVDQIKVMALNSASMRLAGLPCAVETDAKEVVEMAKVFEEYLRGE